MAQRVATVAAAMSRMEYSEDCLYLNVWTPGLDGELPVIVWIYGGGFETGSASPPLTNGAALSRLTGAVVVAANYRVGAFGFGHWLGAGGSDWADSSNLGLQDQLAALSWVRRNIAAFGGDPGNVAVAGESAGAFMIGALLGVPRAVGLFHKAILHSGGAGRVFSAETGDQIARDFLGILGVRTVEELQAVDAGRIVAAQRRVVDTDIGRRNLPGGRSWGIVLDDRLLPRHPLETIRSGALADIPLLVGANRDEVRSYRAAAGEGFMSMGMDELLAEFAVAGVADPSGLLDAYRERLGGRSEADEIREVFLSDALWRRPASSLAAAQVGAGGNAWAFLFAGEPLGPEHGAFHGADLLYTFNHLAYLGLDSPANLAVRDDLLGAWTRFIADGDPGWAAYDLNAPLNTRQFGGDSYYVTEPARDAVLEAWPIR
jgi:para-nitrobenzyl esterase